MWLFHVGRGQLVQAEDGEVAAEWLEENKSSWKTAKQFRDAKHLLLVVGKELVEKPIQKIKAKGVRLGRTRAGGSHGKLHRTTKILSHAQRRGGVVAHGERAAASEGRLAQRKSASDGFGQTGYIPCQYDVDSGGML